MKESRGVTAVVVAIALSVLVAFAAVAIDVGYFLSTRNELQNVADAAALAGARTLGRLYECNGVTTCTTPTPMTYEDQLTYVADEVAIKSAVTGIAALNQAGNKSGISIADTDIAIGTWDAASKALTATLTSPDAVHVTAKRDASANGPISTFLAGIMGINTVNVSATATAALTGQSAAGPGGLPIPVAINKTWLSTLPCNSNLTFHPSSAGVCAAWHSYDGSTYKPNASDMRKMIDAITAGTYSSPETTVGRTSYDFTNGTLASLFTSSTIQDLFNTMKIKNDGILDKDENSATWTTAVAVYDDAVEGCSPNGAIKIVGFSTITITNVSPPPESTIYATLKCDNVDPGRGGGSNFGTKGSIPNLVQ